MPPPFAASLREHVLKQIAREISRAAQFYDVVVFVGQEGPLPWVKAREMVHVRDVAGAVDVLRARAEESVIVVLHGVMNQSLDIASELTALEAALREDTLVLVVAWNPYLRAIYRLADVVGARHGAPLRTFVTEVDLRNVARLGGLAVTRVRRAGYALPTRFARSAWSVVPGARELCFTHVVTLKRRARKHARMSLSVVIPARNERGNIAAAVARLEGWDRGPLEIVFVEGHSRDGTWEEIARVIAGYRGKHTLRAAQQSGEGKADAVRLGFSLAKHELLTILDADLTMPPESLVRFYDAYTEGHGDFINGSRLLYPMEDGSMRFLNRVGNGLFAGALSWVLDTSFGDTLCGTKLLRRTDWERFVAWRGVFGDFDPFGDFELLFAASVFGLEIVDVPIRYRARTYGETQISRFKNGAELLRMTAVGLLRIKAAE